MARRTTRTGGASRSGRSKASATIEGVELTHPDRLLYPEQGLTKRDLAEHYRTVAEWILPHVSNRPLTLVRCPQGREKQCFYQKHVSEVVPGAIRTIDIQEKRKKDSYMYVVDVDGLIGLVQIGVLEMHIWGSRCDRVERPDRLVFDLDPGEGMGFGDVVQAARLLRRRLGDLGLQSFVMTTGGKGLHVVVPVVRRHDFDEAHAFARAVAKSLEAEAPDRFLSESSKRKRKGKIFVDYLRNTRGATAICPYSTRARANAPVAAPVRWDELGPGLDSTTYTVRNVGDRLECLHADPWDGYGALRQSITARAKRDLGMHDN